MGEYKKYTLSGKQKKKNKYFKIHKCHCVLVARYKYVITKYKWRFKRL